MAADPQQIHTQSQGLTNPGTPAAVPNGVDISELTKRVEMLSQELERITRESELADPFEPSSHAEDVPHEPSMPAPSQAPSAPQQQAPVPTQPTPATSDTAVKPASTADTPVVPAAQQPQPSNSPVSQDPEQATRAESITPQIPKPDAGSAATATRDGARLSSLRQQVIESSTHREDANEQAGLYDPLDISNPNRPTIPPSATASQPPQPQPTPRATEPSATADTAAGQKDEPARDFFNTVEWHARNQQAQAAIETGKVQFQPTSDAPAEEPHGMDPAPEMNATPSNAPDQGEVAPVAPLQPVREEPLTMEDLIAPSKNEAPTAQPPVAPTASAPIPASPAIPSQPNEPATITRPEPAVQELVAPEPPQASPAVVLPTPAPAEAAPAKQPEPAQSAPELVEQSPIVPATPPVATPSIQPQSTPTPPATAAIPSAPKENATAPSASAPFELPAREPHPAHDFFDTVQDHTMSEEDPALATQPQSAPHNYPARSRDPSDMANLTGSDLAGVEFVRSEVDDSEAAQPQQTPAVPAAPPQQNIPAAPPAEATASVPNQTPVIPPAPNTSDDVDAEGYGRTHSGSPLTMSVVPPDAKPAPIPTSLKPIRTFQDDVAQSVQTQRASVVTVAAAEQEKKKVQQQEKEAQAKLRPQRPASTTTTSTYVKIGLSGLFIGVSLAGLAFFSLMYNATPSSVVVETLPEYIFTESQTRVDITGQSRREIMNTLLAEKEKVTLRLGAISYLYLTNTSRLPDNREQINLVPAPDFFERLEAQVPGSLARSLDPLMMLGAHVFDGNQPFLIFRVNFFENAFAGMLQWESEINVDLAPLFGPTLLAPARTQTGTASSSTIQSMPYAGQFTDEIIRNKEVRVLRDPEQKIRLLYGFHDRNTLIITTNEFTFAEVVTRLSSRRF